MKIDNNITDTEYHKLPCLSQSAFKQFKASPRDFWETTPLNPNYTPLEASDAMVLGSLCHTMVLEPHKLEDEYTIQDWGTKTRGVKYKKFAEELGSDKTIVSIEEHDKALIVKARLMEHPLASNIIKNSKAEHPVVWEEEGGMLMKGKPDLLTVMDGLNVYVDYKTTAKLEKTPNPNKEGWLLQAIAYKRGLASKRIKIDKVMFIRQNVNKPYIIEVFEISEVDMIAAEAEYLYLVNAITMLYDEYKAGGNPNEVFAHSRELKPTILSAGKWYNDYWMEYDSWKQEHPAGSMVDFIEHWTWDVRN